MAALKRCKRLATYASDNHFGIIYYECTYHHNHGRSREKWVGNTDERSNDPYRRKERQP